MAVAVVNGLPFFFQIGNLLSLFADKRNKLLRGINVVPA